MFTNINLRAYTLSILEKGNEIVGKKEIISIPFPKIQEVDEKKKEIKKRKYNFIIFIGGSIQNKIIKILKRKQLKKREKDQLNKKKDFYNILKNSNIFEKTEKRFLRNLEKQKERRENKFKLLRAESNFKNIENKKIEEKWVKQEMKKDKLYPVIYEFLDQFFDDDYYNFKKMSALLKTFLETKGELKKNSLNHLEWKLSIFVSIEKYKIENPKFDNYSRSYRKKFFLENLKNYESFSISSDFIELMMETKNVISNLNKQLNILENNQRLIELYKKINDSLKTNLLDDDMKKLIDCIPNLKFISEIPDKLDVSINFLKRMIEVRKDTYDFLLKKINVSQINNFHSSRIITLKNTNLPENLIGDPDIENFLKIINFIKQMKKSGFITKDFETELSKLEGFNFDSR